MCELTHGKEGTDEMTYIKKVNDFDAEQAFPFLEDFLSGWRLLAFLPMEFQSKKFRAMYVDGKKDDFGTVQTFKHDVKR